MGIIYIYICSTPGKKLRGGAGVEGGIREKHEEKEAYKCTGGRGRRILGVNRPRHNKNNKNTMAPVNEMTESQTAIHVLPNSNHSRCRSITGQIAGSLKSLHNPMVTFHPLINYKAEPQTITSGEGLLPWI